MPPLRDCRLDSPARAAPDKLKRVAGRRSGARLRVPAKTRTVLIVDDDEDFIRLLVAVLAQRGHRTLVARTGAEGSAEASRSRPDAIVVDGMLPDTDGIKWIVQHRAVDRNVPIFFVSAFWGFVESLRRMPAELGVSFAVQKPLDPVMLCEELEKHDRPRRSELAERGADTPPPAPVRDELAAARAEYARALPGKVRDLTRAVRDGRAGNEDVAVARLRAHKLRGTAGCFGFDDLGAAAALVEDALEATRTGDERRAARAWNDVEAGLAAARDAALRARRHAGGATPVAPGGVGRAHVLVVGDDSALLARLERVGQGQLFDITHVQSASRALSSACRAAPDAALIDLHPKSAEVAFELARQLRALPGAEHLPIAFVSTSDDIELRVAAARAGASLYLARALDDDTLALSVRQLLAARKAERPRVLIVDDDEEQASFLADVLEHHGMIAECLAEPKRIIDALDESRPDLLLVDLSMPTVSGLDVCRIVRTSPSWQDLPTLVVTGRIDAQSRLAALRAGADGYIVKPIVEQELVARIVARIDRLQMVRERYDKDALTGLPLRRSFLERLGRSMAECRRHGRPLALALLDVDRFKLINDTYGHQAGDRVLAALGRLLDARFRAEDLRGRWGGEEFVLAFPGQAPRPLRSALGAALAELAALTFQSAKGESFRVTFSAGLSGFPEDGATVEALLEAADRRLYDAKRAGRARVVCG